MNWISILVPLGIVFTNPVTIIIMYILDYMQHAAVIAKGWHT